MKLLCYKFYDNELTSRAKKSPSPSITTFLTSCGKRLLARNGKTCAIYKSYRFTALTFKHNSLED